MQWTIDNKTGNWNIITDWSNNELDLITTILKEASNKRFPKRCEIGETFMIIFNHGMSSCEKLVIKNWDDMFWIAHGLQMALKHYRPIDSAQAPTGDPSSVPQQQNNNPPIAKSRNRIGFCTDRKEDNSKP
jgi:hypothetical protein